MGHIIISCYRRLVHEEAGQGLVEYGMIVALIAIGTLSLLSLLYDQVASIFGHTATTIHTLMARR